MVAQTGFAPALGYPASGALFLTPLFSKFGSYPDRQQNKMYELTRLRSKKGKVEIREEYSTPLG